MAAQLADLRPLLLIGWGGDHAQKLPQRVDGDISLTSLAPLREGKDEARGADTLDIINCIPALRNQLLYNWLGRYVRDRAPLPNLTPHGD